MVIGNGLVGNRFKKEYATNNDVVIFASGVSNSKCTDETEFIKETELVKATITNNPSKTFLYFSTCSIYDKDEQNSLYILHKKKIENIIQTNSTSWYIFRVSNIIGKTNNNYTFFNFFYHSINKDDFFSLWVNASRNLIDIDDAYLTIDYILKNKLLQNSIINIANPKNTSVIEIVKAIELKLNKKGNYTKADKGNVYSIDISTILPIYTTLKLTFPPQYLSLLLNKYYKKENDI